MGTYWLIRVGSRAILEERFDVVGEADNVDSAIDVAVEREPDIVLFDVRRPGRGGAAVVPAIGKATPAMCLVAFTVSTSRLDVVAMMNAGVDGYLTKATHSEDLPDLLASARNKPVSRKVAGYLLDIDDQIDTGTGIERLTPSEAGTRAHVLVVVTVDHCGWGYNLATGSSRRLE